MQYRVYAQMVAVNRGTKEARLFIQACDFASCPRLASTDSGAPKMKVCSQMPSNIIDLLRFLAPEPEGEHVG